MLGAETEGPVERHEPLLNTSIYVNPSVACSISSVQLPQPDGSLTIGYMVQQQALDFQGLNLGADEDVGRSDGK